jgi:hypothetical protein
VHKVCIHEIVRQPRHAQWFAAKHDCTECAKKKKEEKKEKK